MPAVLHKTRFMLLAVLLTASDIYGQTATEQLKTFILPASVSKKDSGWMQRVSALYKRLNYQTAWTNADNREQLSILTQQIKTCRSLALRPEDYALPYLEEMANTITLPANSNDTMEVEVRISAIAFHFYNDILNGNTDPVFGYTGIKKTTDTGKLTAQIADHILGRKLQALPGLLSAGFFEVNILLGKLQQLIGRNEKTSDVFIVIDRINKVPPMLENRLYQLGLINNPNEVLTDSTRKQVIRNAQRMFNLATDGILNRELVQELNIPVAVRMRQLELSINYYRWLSGMNQNREVIVVNIPAAYLRVYRDNDTILAMRMIVGKASTPTPTLTSVVQEVILYPYWHVPYSIATKEILPMLKRDPGYIKMGNYEVLNSAGKIINSSSINWSLYSAKYFPFTLRQSTGCDNALGLLKLEFPNPFGVYLHDTPVKLFFNAAKRFLSHGCMRMEKPFEMGHLVLQENGIAIDTLSQKGCLLNQSPIAVTAAIKMPVVVWYNPAGTNNEGEPVFYHDIYKKFNWIKQ